MASRDLRLLLPRPIRRLPADLAAALAVVVLADLAALAPVVRETPLRVVLGLPVVLFVPGYVLVAALFPEAGEPLEEGPTEEGAARSPDRGIDGIERVALSFGLSIAVVPLVGLVLNFTPWGIRLVPILASLTALVAVGVGVAAVRRWELPPEERFAVPYREWFAAGRAELVEPETRTDAALNVLLAASVVLAVASVGYAVAVPQQQGESFTEFYLLTRDDGELVAAGYPTEFAVGEGQSLVVGIGNQEHEAVDYDVVVELQRVTFVGNETVIEEERELDRFSASLDHNETLHRDYTIRPTMAGTRLRLAFLLYRDSVPAEPTVENSYRETHLWVNVTAAE